MYQFFYCLYYALFDGSWSINRNTNLVEYINRCFSFLVNAIGGDYQALQSFDFIGQGLSAYGFIANILALITMFGVCFGVLKLTKMVFSIFFGGR